MLGTRRLILLAVLTFLSFIGSIAYADSSSNSAVASLAAYWPQIVILVCASGAWALRKFAPQGHFFHTAAGGLVLTSGVLVLSTISGTVQAHGLSSSVIVQALIGTWFAAIGVSNPGVVAGTTPPMAMKRKDSGKISLGLVMFLALFSFACAGWQVWKNCTLGQLPQIAQTVIPSVVQDLGGVNQDTAISQVESAAGKILPGQLSCIVQAIVADVETKAAAVKGQLGPVQENIVHNGKAFLQKHPAVACGEPPAIIRASIEIATDRSALADTLRSRL